MTQAAKPRLQCALVWALVILAPLLLLALVLVPWSSKLASLDETIERGEDQLSRYRRVVATLPQLKAELERVRTNESLKAFYFDAPTSALAGAQLQSQLQRVVTAAKGRLVSIQILPDEKKETPKRLRVRAQVQGSTDVLLDVLHQIEQERPFLFVQQVSIRSLVRPQQLGPDGRPRVVRRSSVNVAGDLTMRFDVFGFVLGGGS